MKAKINNIELYYERHGKGEPIVFSHGWLGDTSIWQSQVDYFANTNTVILYDHRGHGRSDSPIGDYSVQTLSNDLYTLTQKLDYEKIVLVGFSLGGMAAILFTLEHPNSVSKLVLVGATAKMTLPLSTKFLEILSFLLPYKSFLRRLCRYRFFKPSNRIVEDEFHRALKVDRKIAEECWKEYTKHYDIRDKIAAIGVPTLIIVGEKDEVNREASRYLNNEIKDSELHIMSDIGHTVMIENPEKFNKILEGFIKNFNS